MASSLLTVIMFLLTQITLTTSLWLIRGLMFLLGMVVAQVFVPDQAAAFAMISPASTGRASTLFNTSRQIGSAVGVAVLSTVLIGVGTAQAPEGPRSPTCGPTTWPSRPLRLSPWPGTAFSLTIHDSDAAETMVRRSRPKRSSAQAVSVSDSAA